MRAAGRHLAIFGLMAKPICNLLKIRQLSLFKDAFKEINFDRLFDIKPFEE